MTDAFISDYGCNIRLGSIITDKILPITKRTITTPYENCLYFFDGTCKKCIERCPVGALNESGHDKIKCRAFGRQNAMKMQKKYGDLLHPSSIRVEGKIRNRRYPAVGCALCQFEIPCMDSNPMRHKKRKKINYK